MNTKKSIAIVGSGPSALMLACTLSNQKFDVSIFEQNKAVGRKFLVAGDGGLNITHSENLDVFATRYLPNEFMKTHLHNFSNTNLRAWLKKIGVETFIGSSKRVFPKKGIKPIAVLNAIVNEVKRNQVKILLEHKWIGWDKNNCIIIEHEQKQKTFCFDYVVFALGGSSWNITGSTGNWLNLFTEKGIQTKPFQASNCAVICEWPLGFSKKNEGKHLKNISIKAKNGICKKGEIVITATGIEGGAIYALANYFRDELRFKNNTEIFIDLKPSFDLDKIKMILSNRKNKSVSYQLKNVLKLNQTAIELLSILSKDEYNHVEKLSHHIKNFKINVSSLAPINDAISTVGGIALEAVNEHVELIQLSNQFAIGEMLDWDAPTGGYLLQACFSMGNALGIYLNAKKH
jgi:uncharacterized flavoprotein (TIGR03862 family)